MQTYIALPLVQFQQISLDFLKHAQLSGEIIDMRLARIREREYAKDESIGSFMYFFKYQNKQYCVDATDETPYKGRLINHSMIKPNLKTKVYW